MPDSSLRSLMGDPNTAISSLHSKFRNAAMIGLCPKVTIIRRKFQKEKKQKKKAPRI
jgi:hypothetical protein